MSRTWPISRVLSMEGDRERFSHVAKHLYNPSEEWQHVISDLGDARQRAWDCGCAEALLEAEHPDCDRVAPSCRAHVLHDHDNRMAPAYREALASADAAGRYGELSSGGRGWALVGDHGVYVVVREVGHASTPQVKTAYRVQPRQHRPPSSKEFLKAAVRKLRDKTSWTEGGK